MSTSPSAICTVNGVPLATSGTTGFNANPGDTITIALANSSGVNTWNIICTASDGVNGNSTPSIINASSAVDYVNYSATFVMPQYFTDGFGNEFGAAMQFTSVVNAGQWNSNTITLGIWVVLSGQGRLFFTSENLESDATYGVSHDLNELHTVTALTGLTGDVDATGPGVAAAEVVGIQSISVPTPSGSNTVLTYNSGAFSWASVGGGGSVPVVRGLTYSIQARAGCVPSDAPTTTCIGLIYDQAPAQSGKYFFAESSTDGPTPANGINGNPTLLFVAGSEFTHRPTVTYTCDYFYSSAELTIAACFLYTGSAPVDTSDFTQMPMIAGDDIFNVAGISCGLTGGSLYVIGWVYDYNANAIKYAQSVALNPAVGHVVVMTYSLTTGNITLYVDALAPVVTGSVGQPVALNLGGGRIMQVGACYSYTTTTQFIGHLLELDGWNVCLTSTEISEVQAYLNAQSGL